MKVKTYHTTTLKAINLPFRLIIQWNKKLDVNGDFWFTPTGQGNVWIGDLSMISLGNVSDKDDKDIIKLMKKYKTDILTDGRAYYTRGMSGLVEITNGYSLINQMNKYWHDRKDDWNNSYEPKKEFIEDLEPLSVIES
jgi:hypothetical protein